MLIICEECGKKYKVDETKIKGEKVVVKCKVCGHIFKINKPDSLDMGKVFEDREKKSSSEDTLNDKLKTEKSLPKGKSKIKNKTEKHRSKGFKISTKLLFLFLGFVFLTGGSLTFVYMKTVPPIIEKQLEMRAMDIARTAANIMSAPMRERNYLKINQNANFFSRLSGVGYFYVTNPKGIVVAGKFGHLNMFSPDFVSRIKKEGFPSDFATKNRMPQGLRMRRKKVTLGGQNMIEYAVKLKGDTGEVHVGIFTKDVEKAIETTVRPLLVVLCFMTLFGIVSLFMVAYTISRPIKKLTDIAHRISLGELDLSVDVRGGGEIADLVSSIERMRFSIKSAIERLRKR